ncbi:MAG: hypothetical protein QS748_01880 [Candidatus Endonucleobacter bathymodioli]|uniref:Uncharacterized protein n=1 Tax=Candidatus Endonucleibacter bathymodioli TaxID=539814 RepID=A0AA90NPE6_9GAMM|nr:hypothetical protein [Candidatus Endonucleobacter bathymodioli]
MGNIKISNVNNNPVKATAAEGINSKEEFIKTQRKFYEEKRASEKNIIYNQLIANDYTGSSKDRKSKMVALVARHRFVI